ncbi:MAG: hypothetical protein H6825_01450 [Planctomycetes bacterium]|nr:hypothetical protein [Planctomycetota bacterium]
MSRLIVLVALGGMVLSCNEADVASTPDSDHDQPRSSTIFTLSGNGPPPNIAWEEAPEVEVTYGDLASRRNRYEEPFGEAGKDEAVVKCGALDSSIIVLVTGRGPWWESSTVVLEFDRASTGDLQLSAASVDWGADVPPFTTWLRSLRGSVVIAHGDDELEAEFSLSGYTTGNHEHAYSVSGAFNIRLPASMEALQGTTVDRYRRDRARPHPQADRPSAGH